MAEKKQFIQNLRVLLTWVNVGIAILALVLLLIVGGVVS
jgi:hypothetical protein